MQVTINLYATCPVCGHRNQGLQIGTAQPRMTSIRLQAGSIGWTPPACQECSHPLDRGLFDQGTFTLDAVSAAKLNTWRQRQRDRRANRKRGAA